jgi:cytochrome P450
MATTDMPEVRIPLRNLTRSGGVRLRGMLEQVRGHRMILFRIALGAYRIVNDAEIARQVLQENRKNYPKSSNYNQLKGFLGNGLLTSDGDFWLRQRRLAQPAFHHKQLAKLFSTMVETCNDLLTGWEAVAGQDRTLDVSREMMRVTLSVVGRTLLSTDLASAAGDVGPALTYLLKDTDSRMFSPVRIPRSIPTPKNLRFWKARAAIDGRVLGVIRERRAQGDDGPQDLLAMLLQARDADTGEGMTDAQLRDEVMTLVLAGHETTANAMSWTLALLSRHPDIRARLEDEVDRALGGRTPTFEDLPRLSYASMVFQEAMRLYPPIWIIERQAVAADTLGGFKIPAGAFVTISPFLLHFHPDYWENPAGFDPLRFLPEAVQKRPPFAYLPFGGGPRVCIGNQFALMEAQILLAMIVQRFRLDLDPTHALEPELMLTMRPAGGMPMYLSRRTVAAVVARAPAA